MLRRFVESVNLLLMGIVLAVNELETQFWAIVVLAIGCGMLVETKRTGIDTTVAGGVIGVASNMLTGQIKRAITAVTRPDGTRTRTTTEEATNVKPDASSSRDPADPTLPRP